MSDAELRDPTNPFNPADPLPETVVRGWLKAVEEGEWQSAFTPLLLDRAKHLARLLGWTDYSAIHLDRDSESFQVYWEFRTPRGSEITRQVAPLSYLWKYDFWVLSRHAFASSPAGREEALGVARLVLEKAEETHAVATRRLEEARRRLAELEAVDKE